MIGRLRGLLVFVMVLPMLGGCIGPGGLKRADPLSGSNWRLVQLGEVQALPDVEVTLRLNEGQADGSAGCNHYGGAYVVSRHELTFGVLESTLMACLDEDVMTQEQRYLHMLGQADTWEFKGIRLYIYTADGEMLLFAPAD